MLADMNDGVTAPDLAQPAVESEIVVRRHQLRVVVARLGVELVAACGLDANEGATATEAGDHESACAQHRVGIGCAPTRADGGAVGLRQAVEEAEVIGQRQALVGGAQCPLCRVVGDALLQLRHQRVAVRRDGVDGMAVVAQALEDGDHRGGGVQPHAIAQPAFTRRIVGEDEREALVGVGKRAQAAPAPCQLGDEIDALGVGLVVHDVALGMCAAMAQALEADGAGDDAAIDFGHGDVHGDVAWRQPVRIGTPVFLVAAGQHQLQHRDVAGEGVVARLIQSRLRKCGGVEDECHLMLGAQLVQRLHARRILQRQQGQRQRVQALRAQCFA